MVVELVNFEPAVRAALPRAITKMSQAPMTTNRLRAHKWARRDMVSTDLSVVTDRYPISVARLRSRDVSPTRCSRATANAVLGQLLLELSSSSSGPDELLAAIDVVGRAGEGRVGHQMDGQRGHVGGPDDAADRQSGPQLLAAPVEVVPEQGG